jgi:hypothetical protein
MAGNSLTLLTCWRRSSCTGKNLDELVAEDLFEIRAWRIFDIGRAISGIHAAWELLTVIGILPADSSLRGTLRAGSGPLHS